MDERLESLEIKVEQFSNNLEDYLDDVFKRRLDSWLEQTLTVSCISEEIERRFRLSQAEIEKHVVENQRLEEEIVHTKNNLSLHQKEIDKLKFELREAKVELEYRAYKDDLKKVINDIQALCPRLVVQELEKVVQTKATNADLRSLTQAHECLQQDLVTDYLRVSEATTQFARLEHAFTGMFASYATIDQVDTVAAAAANKCSLLHKELGEIKKKQRQDVTTLNEKLIIIKKVTDKKIEQPEVDKIYPLLHEKASTQQLEEVSRKLDPVIEHTRQSLREFNQKMNEQELAMLRIDEVVLDKASKFDLKHLESQIKAISRHVDLEFKIDEMVANLETMLEFSRKAQGEFAVMRSHMQEMLGFYRKKVNESVELQCLRDSIKDLRTSLSYKTDRCEALDYLEHKAAVADVLSLREHMAAVHKNTELIAVQLSALSRLWAEPFRGRYSDRNQKDFLVKASQQLVDYIMQHRPGHTPSLPEELSSNLPTPAPTPAPRRASSSMLRDRPPLRKVNRSVDLLAKHIS